MVHRQEVQVQTRDPDGGNPTPRRQGHVWRDAGTTRFVPYTTFTVRACLVEVVGARPFRAKAKRRKAAPVGELAASSEARSPYVTASGSGDGMVVKSVDLTRGAVQGR